MKKKKKSSNNILIITSIMFFIMGVSIYFYPTISNYFVEKKQQEVIIAYDDTVDKRKELVEKEWDKAKIYNENLAGNPVHDPFVPNSGYALPDNYVQVLNINQDGIMGYLEIPKIDLNLPIYHGTSEEVLEKGVGHLEGTYLPIGGKNRHSVLSAHRGLPSAELFTYLNELVAGDIFYVHILDNTFAYKVKQVEVILPEDIQKLKAIQEEDLVTLMTCTPYAVNSHRLLVQGSRIEYVEQEAEEVRNEMNLGLRLRIKENIGFIILGLLLVLILVVVYIKKKIQFSKR